MPLVYKDFTQNVRMDSGFEWEDKNPIVNKNEIAFNYDTLQYKLGDGIHTYKQLPFCTKYFSDYTNIFPLLEGVPKEEFEEVQNFCLEVGLPVTLEEIGVTTAEQVETIAKNACVPGETIHNLAGDVQPIELRDAIMQADAMGKIALGK